MRQFLCMAACAFLCIAAAAPASGEDIAVLFTGRTHGMIYHCNCPLEPSGGVTRRATAVKEFAKKKVPYILVDSGDFFAGGVMDQYSLGEALDRARTEFNLRAMEAMDYACAAVTPGELNFGGEFFLKTALSSKVPFVCCNIRAEGITPFVIKKTGSTIVGVTAVAPEEVQKKLSSATYTAAEQALKDTISQMRAKGCMSIILMSSLPQSESLKLVEEVPGVDLLILNQPAEDNQPLNAKGTLVLVSPWQGRRLGEAVLSLTPQGKIQQVNVAEELLSIKMAEDNEILKTIPRCFTNSDCAAPGQIGTCNAPGKLAAQCSFVAAPKVRMVIIETKDCLTCNSESIPQGLAASVPGLVVTRVEYPGAEAEEYIKKVDVNTLPIFLLGKEIDREKGFEKMKEGLEPAGEYYRIKPSVAGFGYFISRPAVPDRLDVFVSLYAKGTRALLENLKEFTPVVHFIASEEKGAFKVEHGTGEWEEDLRSVCVRKYYPGFFYNYLICRVANPESSWWDACLENVDGAVVRTCAMGTEGAQLLRENIALEKELNITFGPTFLRENKEIFSAANVPTKEELRKILIRK